MKGFRLVHAVALIAGLLFLYVPIGILILYSFNASRLVTVWGGFSTQWYATLLSNQALKDAALLSLAWRWLPRPSRLSSARWPRWHWSAHGRAVPSCCSAG